MAAVGEGAGQTTGEGGDEQSEAAPNQVDGKGERDPWAGGGGEGEPTESTQNSHDRAGEDMAPRAGARSPGTPDGGLDVGEGSGGDPEWAAWAEGGQEARDEEDSSAVLPREGAEVPLAGLESGEGRLIVLVSPTTIPSQFRPSIIGQRSEYEDCVSIVRVFEVFVFCST